MSPIRSQSIKYFLVFFGVASVCITVRFLITKQSYHSVQVSNDFAYKYGVHPYREVQISIDYQLVKNLGSLREFLK